MAPAHPHATGIVVYPAFYRSCVPSVCQSIANTFLVSSHALLSHALFEIRKMIWLFIFPSDEMFPLSDGQREGHIKRCLPGDVSGNLTSVVESLNQQYFKKDIHQQSGQVTDDIIKAIPLEFSFVQMAPSGMFKRSLPNYSATSPALERVCPLLADDYNNKSKRFTSAALNIYQCNASCSEVTEWMIEWTIEGLND